MRTILLPLVAIAAVVPDSLGAPDTRDTAIVSSPGSTVPIGGWYMQSTAHTSENMITLSKPGADTSSWYRVGSYGTVMVCFYRDTSRGKLADSLGRSPREQSLQ
jgi:exo-1,4-beta-D-glucosaminidase